MLKARIISAAFLLPLVACIIFFVPPVYFSLIMALIILIAGWEWSRLAGFDAIFSRVCCCIVLAAGLFFISFLPIVYPLSIAVGCWLWALGAIVVYQLKGHALLFQWPIVRLLLGFIFLIATWIAIMVLQTHPAFGPVWLCLVLLVIFAADIGAYVMGRWVGKTPLCSRVSPNKTWEGFCGGMIFSIGLGAMAGLFFKFSLMHYFVLLLLILLCAIGSVIGDLTVSLLKRLAQLKDTGAIIPGHGGLLDRLDSIACSTVVFVFAAFWLGF